MIKLYICELLFEYCDNRPSGIAQKEIFINESLVESSRIVEHTIYTFNGECYWTPQGAYNIAEGSKVSFFKELTMSSGAKYLTKDQFNFFGGNV